jgi:phosphoenolpyruvate carboxylase
MTAVRTEEALSRDIHLLGDLLGEVIVELEGHEFFELEEAVREASKARRSRRPNAASELRSLIADQPIDTLTALIKAFSNYFQLVNLAEDAHRVRVLRARERQGVLADSLEEAVDALEQSGLSAEERRRLLDSLAVRLVFTAHPTESKRSVVLAKLRGLAAALEEMEQPGLLAREQRRLMTAARAAVVSLWQTRTARPERPSVLDEVYHGLYFITETLVDAIPQLQQDVEALVQRDPELASWDGSGVLRFGTWAGGDRDGNPSVTPRTTISALEIGRREAEDYYLRQVRRLSEQLSQSTDQVGVSAQLQRSIAADAAEDPRLAAEMETRYPGEPYRQKLGFIAARLSEGRYRASIEMLRELRVMDISLRENSAEPAASIWLGRLLRQVTTFGLNLAAMEIRQESSRHHTALDEILADNGQPGYLQLEPAARAELLTSALVERGLRPALDLSEASEDVWMTFRAIAEGHARFGEQAIDTYVISMTACAADVLAVLLLGELANVSDALDIVPLFETAEDLQAAPLVVAELFACEPYRRHLEKRGNRQQVMIGYSDSNKSEGYLAAHWALYEAQGELARLCNTRGITLELFHGRGGTTARGGGPTNRAILGQPGGTVRGRIKVTEQGEVIAERYANRQIAYRHLSQVLNAVIRASLRSEEEVPRSWFETLTVGGDAARTAYCELINSDGFGEYFQQATPLEEITRLTIGSRPARRAVELKPGTLRAIPWVFAWMQCRANVPGWFGLGSGLSAAASKGLVSLHELYQSWHFFSAVIDNAEMALAKTDLSIASLYTELVADRTLRERIFSVISSEYERTVALVLQATGSTQLLAGSPELRLSIERRNPYVDPLNYLQVELLKRVRAAREGDPEHKPLLAAIFQTINGIAAGMKNTG